MSVTFKHHRAPDGFEFPLSRKQLRSLAKSEGVKFGTIETKGISMSEGFKTKALGPIVTDRHAGILKATRGPEGWMFDLSVCALRSTDIRPSAGAVSASLIADIDAWILKVLRLPETAPSSKVQLFLGFRTTEDGVETASHEVSCR